MPKYLLTFDIFILHQDTLPFLLLWYQPSLPGTCSVQRLGFSVGRGRTGWKGLMEKKPSPGKPASNLAPGKPKQHLRGNELEFSALEAGNAAVWGLGTLRNDQQAEAENELWLLSQGPKRSPPSLPSPHTLFWCPCHPPPAVPELDGETPSRDPSSLKHGGPNQGCTSLPQSELTKFSVPRIWNWSSEVRLLRQH